MLVKILFSAFQNIELKNGWFERVVTLAAVIRQSHPWHDGFFWFFLFPGVRSRVLRSSWTQCAGAGRFPENSSQSQSLY